MSSFPPDILYHGELDARLINAVRGIRLLTLSSWPASEQDKFLTDYARGKPRLPRHEYPKLDFSDSRRELEAITKSADSEHPLGEYLIDTARDWITATRLLEVLGTQRAGVYAVELYGRPDEHLPGGPTTREAARHFIDIANELDRELLSAGEQVEMPASSLQAQLQDDLDEFFDGRVIEVELDPNLIAKAAAGSTRIRLRAGASYTDYDRHQLFQHEALVHSLTGLNGRLQPVMGSMALSSPRVTETQEGLATFAEQITGSIDIERMKRLSLRINAVAMALEGANFIEVFDYFLKSGQSSQDSFSSAQRVFRGVPTDGGCAFTKDSVYLRGLIGVHTFFRQALRHGKLRHCRMLFAGKMTLADVERFEPLFESGAIAPARWLPRWVSRANGLAGVLAFSLFANKVRLDRIVDETTPTLP